MHRSVLHTCLLAVALLIAAQSGTVAETKCPGGSNDDCDRWYFEQADKDLAGVVTAVLARIEEFAHPQTRQEAKDKFVESQRVWTTLRGLECEAESAFVWLRSARTREGYTASCLQRHTAQRIETLKRRYLLNN